MPTATAGLLRCGLPRVITESCEVRRGPDPGATLHVVAREARAGTRAGAQRRLAARYVSYIAWPGDPDEGCPKVGAGDVFVEL